MFQVVLTVGLHIVGADPLVYDAAGVLLQIEKTMTRWIVLLGWAAGFLSGFGTATALDLYIAPDGSDAWSGRRLQPNSEHTDGPLASLSGARDALRRLKSAGAVAEPARIVIADGTYRMTGPLVLTAEDSGTPQAPIRYEAAVGAHPVFSGGRVIGGWHEGNAGIWQVLVPAAAAGKWYFEQLFVNGRRAVRARTPAIFYFYMRNIVEEKIADGTAAAGAGRARQIIGMRPQDFAAIASLTPEELKDVTLVVFHNWDITRHFIDSVDRARWTIATIGEPMKSWNRWEAKTPFILENVRAALDEPGEWFLSRDGTLFYKPLPGEDMGKAEVVAPVADRFIDIEGDAAAHHPVTQVAFKGLKFEHGQWLSPPGGFEPVQAAASIDAVVRMDGAQDVSFEDCEIAHVGTYGFWFRRGCRDDVIRHCYLQDLGAGGIKVGETEIPTREAARTGHVTVDNNIIAHGGRIFACAVGVWVGQSGDNFITHNEIADLFYTGISAGWCWGYGRSLAKRNTIAFNRVHHIGQGVLSDLGGIYTLGPSEGSVVTNNVFHDIYAHAYGGWGLYADEGSSGIRFENNLVYNTASGGFDQHYGKGNVVRNNVLALGTLRQVEVTQAEPHLSVTFEHNVIYWNQGAGLADAPWDRIQAVMRSNCYWNVSGRVQFMGKSLAQWQAAGHESGSIVANPLFANPVRSDFHLNPRSPALRLGFRPFNSEQAGVYGDAAWVAIARNIECPPLQIAPEPWK